MNIILFDTHRSDLFPFALRRAIADIPIGSLSNAQRWQLLLPDTSISYQTESYLSDKYPTQYTEDNYFIDARIIPNTAFTEALSTLTSESSLYYNGQCIATRTSHSKFVSYTEYQQETFNINIIKYTWGLLSFNKILFEDDFKLITQHKTSFPIGKDVYQTGHQDIFIDENVQLHNASLNTSEGSIYIGKNVIIMEGCHLRGPIYIGDDSIVKMGSKIYGRTIIGKHCKVGGEIKNSQIMSYSNKAHEGYLGDSIIGSWCNIGAHSSNSNMKNNRSPVRVWNYTTKEYINTHLPFFGMVMGDYCSCGIHSALNTGSTIGSFSNIFDTTLHKKYISEFSWGSSQDKQVYQIEKLFADIDKIMQQKQQSLDANDKTIIEYLYHHYNQYL